MRKLFALLGMVLLSRFSFADPSTIGTQPPSAGWSFGNVTYAQEGGSLILNSLSDRYGIAQFQTANTNGQSTQMLGNADYIPENAVKNQLAIDGYTNAWDYNPQYTGIDASYYNQPLPTNIPLTELSFSGLAGDPTAIQNVYVPTSEYNALSAQGQAASISSLNTGLAATNNQVNTNTGNITTLQSGLATTNASLVGTQNMTDNSVITNTVKTNTVNIATLGTGLAQTNTQVNTNTANIGNLYTGLNNETVRAQGIEAGLQNQVNSTNQQVSSLDNRVSNLERLKVMPEAVVRFYDDKHLSLAAYDAFDSTNGRNYAVGVRATLKIGKSYEERIIEKQQKQIDELERILHRIAQEN